MRAARAALLALALLATPAAAEGPRLEGGRVRWSLAPAPPPPESAASAELLAAARTRRHARERLAVGDTLAADSVLASAVLARSVWAWESLRQRTELALARGDSARADRLLARAERTDWPEAERAAWLAQRVRVRAALGDTSAALALARQAIRAYPALAGGVQALRHLEAMLRARGDSLPADDARAAAEVEVLRADRGAAIRRLAALHARAPATERGALALRLVQQHRAARRWTGARAWADSAVRHAATHAARSRARLEQARALRDAGATDSALAAYARLARTADEAEVRADAGWELAREAQDRGRYTLAESAFVRVAAAGGRRADDARRLAGLVALARGDAAAARGHMVLAAGEAARFWEGVLARRAPDGRARGDSLLADLAARPGYGFHRASARESLGVRGWPGTLAAAASADSATTVVLATVRRLWAEGDSAEAASLLQRWAAGDPRAGPATRGIGDWLAAAAAAYAHGRVTQATGLVDRALALAGSQPDSVQWALIAWAYPPAFEALVRAEARDSLGLDPALLWGLVRQESRFDPRARSRSDALGLTQLKVATAGDVAGWLREPPPDAAMLLEPARSLRYGARYLRHLLQRFDGQLPVALAAYNAGPGTIRRDWRGLLAQGGAALFCEFASNADSQDYARRILGFASAYRELGAGE